MRRERIAMVAGLVGLVLIVVAVLASRPPEVATPAPSPVSPSPASATRATAMPTASPSASTTPQGLYLSKKLGFALELPPPWRKANCGNVDADDFPGIAESRESFTSASPLEEPVGHVGPFWGVTVFLSPLPQGRTVRQVAETVASGTGASIKDVTVAGRPAIEAETPSREEFYYFIGDGDRYYRVGYQTFRPATVPPVPQADVAAMQRIVRSFRFLSAAERQALPDPTPVPAAAPTAHTLAGMLKAAFEGKDVAALERLLGPCVSVGARSGGVSSLARQRYVAELRMQLAAGLTVTVDTNAIRTEEGFYGTTVASRWNAVPAGQRTPPPTPGGQSYNVELLLGRTTGGFFWRGTLISFAPPG